MRLLYKRSWYSIYQITRGCVDFGCVHPRTMIMGSHPWLFQFQGWASACLTKQLLTCDEAIQTEVTLSRRPFLCLDTAVTDQLVQGEYRLHFLVVCLWNSLTNNLFVCLFVKDNVCLGPDRFQMMPNCCSSASISLQWQKILLTPSFILNCRHLQITVTGLQLLTPSL